MDRGTGSRETAGPVLAHQVDRLKHSSRTGRFSMTAVGQVWTFLSYQRVPVSAGTRASVAVAANMVSN
jgi:hypothetical protein